MNIENKGPQSGADYPGSAGEPLTIGDLLRRYASAVPEADAICALDRASASYAMLMDRSEHVRNLLNGLVYAVVC